MTAANEPSSAAGDELAKQVEAAKRWARLLNESRASLDDARREVFKAVSTLTSAQLELTETTAAVGDKLAASILAKIDAGEARLSDRMRSHASVIREDMRHAAVTGASQLMDAADAVRSAESSFSGGAELLKRYADSYRASWTRAAEGLIVDFDRRWDGVASEQRHLVAEVRKWLPVIETAHQQAAVHAEQLAEHASLLRKLNADIRRPVREEIAPLRRLQRLTFVLLTVNALVLLGLIAYAVIDAM